MRDQIIRRVPGISALTTVAAIVAVFGGILAGGCGEIDVPEVPNEGGSTVTTDLPALPPIDLAAPSSFETASFALG